MKTDIINGFDEKQIFQLYSFLVAYEDAGIGKYTSTKSLIEDHPELLGIDILLKNINCHKSNAEEMKNIDIKLLHNEIYFTKNKKNNLLSFLAHLRNSIAHGCTVKFNDCILITDFENPKFHPTYFTARGCVEFEIINRFTHKIRYIEL